MSELILDTSFEELRSRFPESQMSIKLMEFVEPLPEVEGELNEIAASLSNSGKLVFILGRPGTGKSTFIQSLSWRPHLRIYKLIQLDANEYIEDQSLNGLFQKLDELGKAATSTRDKGPTCVAVNYLENLADFEPDVIKGFFRRLNGLLRTRPLLVLWPVTSETDVAEMRSFSQDVSGTLFYRSKEILNFRGPSEQKFVDIAKRTISVLNEGRELSDFSLTTDDLEEVLENQLRKLPEIQRTLREYLELVRERWKEATQYQARMREKIPKSTEVWFIFSFKDAESVISQFVRRSHRVEDNWAAIHDKFFEYVHSNTQRSAVWNAKRLQLALYGAIKTRVMFLPTNTLVSCVGAYTTNPVLKARLDKASIPEAWLDKAGAKRTLSRTALYKQVMGELLPTGKRKSGPAAVALTQATPLFENIVSWITTGGGSDTEVNKCVGQALGELTGFEVTCDKAHPWIPNVVPDLYLDIGHRQVCVEFHHTSRDEPGIVADYVLRKLDVYMNQLKQLMNPS